MHFILVERHEAPFVSCHIYADVGPAEDPPGKTGLANMLMHMAFKGTSKVGTKNFTLEKKALVEQDQAFAALAAERARGEQADKSRLKELEEAFRKASEAADRLGEPDEYSMIVGAAGGVNVNAFIDPDRILYFYSLPSNKLELWFLLESNRFLDPVMRDFYKAKEISREQHQFAQNNPQRRVIREFLAASYQVHPYRYPETGLPSDLEKLRRSDAEEFFRQKYSASGLITVLIGDVNPAEARRWAEKYFGRLPRRPPREPLKAVEPPQENERRSTLRILPVSALFIGYRAVDARHPDYAAITVMQDVLGRQASSSIHNTLVVEKKVAVAIQGFPLVPGIRYTAMSGFAILPAPGQTMETVEKTFDDTIERFQKEPLDPEIVAQAKRRALKNILDQMLAPVALADLLARFQSITGNWRNLFTTIEMIDKVTPQGLQEVAARYLQKKNRTVLVFEAGAPLGQ